NSSKKTDSRKGRVAPKCLGSPLSRTYNSAWPDVDGRSPADCWVQPMSVPERQSQAPSELRAFIDNNPAMLWSATPEGAVDYCNRPWLDFTSMTADEAEGWGWATAIYPEDRDGLIEC